MENLYKNQIYGLGELRIKSEPMDEVWVYLNHFKDDDILTGEYIYNYGLMSPEMKKCVGMVFDHENYIQKVVSMSFENLKVLYDKQILEEKQLEEKYPGIVIFPKKKEVIKQKYAYGWVAPDGKFYEVQWGKHQEWAYEWIVSHVNDPELKNFNRLMDNKAGDYLLERGWVLIHNPNPKRITPLIQRNETKRFTRKQKIFLFDYYMNIGKKRKAKEIMDD